MMKATEPINRKILLLGLDGMDPRFTRWMVDHGKMPNTKKIIERGSAREDLVLLGAIPTVTPPMWTTLATGAYPNTHGITGFFRASEKDLDYIEYNIDSRLCKAEPLWNVTAEAGLKTLVFHWPGASWPPTSDSENLFVVDGTGPGSVNMGVAQVEKEFLFGASKGFSNPRVIPPGASDAVPPCAVTDLELDNGADDGGEFYDGSGNVKPAGALHTVLTGYDAGQAGNPDTPMQKVISPIKEATGWAAAPEGALEFTILFSDGMVRRSALVLKNDEGVYDRVAIYKTKKDTEPIVTIAKGEMARQVIDESVKDDKRYTVNRSIKVLDIDPAGETLRMWVSAAMDTTMDEVWHPRRLFHEVAQNVGFPPPTAMSGRQETELITDIMLDAWDTIVDWQADSMNYLIEHEGIDVVFSHYHAIDMQSHQVTRYMTDQPGKEGHQGPLWGKQTPEQNHKYMEDIYTQADNYIGRFVHLLDEGWTMFIFSDHAQLAAEHGFRLMGDAVGVSTPVMEQLGLTATIKDENGNSTKEIDWTKTYAVQQRCNQIYLNIKGRNKHTLPDGTVIDGLIDPADQYEWEEEVMTRLYGYKDPATGKRIIGLALRNREAAILGLSGPECGDIIFTMAEGYTYDHGESLSTSQGPGDTSVSPIFIAAGKGIRQGYVTDRVIREVDVVPTVAVIAGVRMPAQCEGAPAYQIIEG